MAHHPRPGVAVRGKMPHPISLRSSPRTTLCKTAAKSAFLFQMISSNIRMVFSQRSLEIISTKVKTSASPVVKILIDVITQGNLIRKNMEGIWGICRREIIKDCLLSILDYLPLWSTIIPKKSEACTIFLQASLFHLKIAPAQKSHGVTLSDGITT